MTSRRYILIFVMVMLFIFSFILRIYQLDTIPGNLNPDEVDTLRHYLLGNDASILGLNWNGAPALNMYIIGWSWSIFGESISGLRLPSALFSSLAVSLTFLVGFLYTRHIFLSSVFAIGLSTNAWFLNFSRNAWENIFNSVAVLLVVLGLYYYFEKKSYRISCISIILGSALGFYWYHPGKLLFPVTLFILIISIFISFKNFRRKILFLFVFIFATVCIIAPQMYTSWKFKERSTHRIQAVSIFNPDNEVNITKHITKNLKGFTLFTIPEFHNGVWSRYVLPEQPPIPGFVTLFYLIGLVLSMKYFPYLTTIYLLLLLPVQVFSIATPDAARAVHLVPLVYLFSLIGCFKLLFFFKNYISHSHTYLVRSLEYSFCIILLIISFFELQNYFEWVQKEDTLKTRQPAIENAEYEAWKSSIKEFSRDGKTFNIHDWRENGKNL